MSYRTGGLVTILAPSSSTSRRSLPTAPTIPARRAPHEWVAKTLTGILHNEKDESVVDAGVEMVRLHKCPEIGKILIAATQKAQGIKPHYPTKPKGPVDPNPTMPQAVDIGTKLRLGYLGIMNDMDKVEGAKNLIAVLQSEENFDVIQVAFDVLKKNRGQLGVDDLVKMAKKKVMEH